MQGWVRIAKKNASGKSNVDLLEENNRLKELAPAQAETTILKEERRSASTKLDVFCGS